MDSLPKDVINMVVKYMDTRITWKHEESVYDYHTLIIECGEHKDEITIDTHTNGAVTISKLSAFIDAINKKQDAKLELVWLDYGICIALFYKGDKNQFNFSVEWWVKYIPVSANDQIMDWLAYLKKVLTK